jgi:hypothetical protein
MSKKSRLDRRREVAAFRLNVIGQLLSESLCQGDLKASLETLAQKLWDHPTKGPRTKIAFSTIEGWYYQAKKNPNDLASVLAHLFPQNFESGSGLQTVYAAPSRSLATGKLWRVGTIHKPYCGFPVDCQVAAKLI